MPIYLPNPCDDMNAARSARLFVPARQAFTPDLMRARTHTPHGDAILNPLDLIQCIPNL